MIATISIVTLTFFVAALVGYLGYLAFGNSVKSVILYSLPNDDPLSITAKVCYVFTIVGSFVLIIQPIFYIIESSSWYQPSKPAENDDAAKKDKQAAGLSASNQDGAVNEGGNAESADSNQADDEAPFSCWELTKHIFFRTLVVVLVVVLAFLIPNLHLLLTFCGAVLGTIVNILLPVLFYNRAYNMGDKNRALDRRGEMEEGEKLMDRDEEDKSKPKVEGDPRRWIKICSWIALAFGVVVGTWGLVYSIAELTNGDAKPDEA